MTADVRANACISKAAIEALALERMQQVFAASDARLNSVTLIETQPSVCIQPQQSMSFSIAENGFIFNKMWLDLLLPEHQVVRFQAEFSFDKRAWRLKQPLLANSLLSMADVSATWQKGSRLTVNDALFADPEQQYRVLRNLRKHQFVSTSDIAPLRLIEVGQKVLAKYQSGGIKLEAKARALSAGNVNDTITVLLSHQKEPVNAVVQNRMEVYVQQ